MSHVIRTFHQAATQEMIARLIKAGYLQPAQQNDAAAVAKAITQMKNDLRGSGNEDSGPRVG